DEPSRQGVTGTGAARVLEPRVRTGTHYAAPLRRGHNPRPGERRRELIAPVGKRDGGGRVIDHLIQTPGGGHAGRRHESRRDPRWQREDDRLRFERGAAGQREAPTA